MSAGDAVKLSPEMDSDFVFIVGIARTGSKIYMSTLNDHTAVDIVSELHYLAPSYVRADFITSVRRHLGKPLGEATPQELVDVMFSGTLNGTFWELKDSTANLRQRICDLDRDALVRQLAERPLSWDYVLRVLLEEHRRVAGKARPGAKFPVDISRVDLLIERFPGALIVHLIRDPRAIYASMVERELRSEGTGVGTRAAIRLARLGYLILQYRRAADLHRRRQPSPNYYLARFEDTVGIPDTTLPALCRFLRVDPNPAMFSPPVKDSSFSRSRITGFSTAAIDSWRRHISRAEAALIERILHREMSLFGYPAGRGDAPKDVPNDR